MPITRQSESHQTTLLAGILAGIFLVGLAMVILIQLLVFPASQSGQFASIFTDSRIGRIILFTIYQAALSTILSIAFGIVLAWSLAHQRHIPFRKALIALISSALVLPTLVVALGIVTVYGRNGWLAELNYVFFGEPLPFSIYGLTGILVAHIFFNASFAARILLHRFESIPDERHKLGIALGMGFWQKIRLIELPAITGSLSGLAVTIFLLCFTSFAIVLTLGGSPAYNTLEVSIYEAIKFDFDLPRAFQLAMVQIIFCVFLVLLASIHADTNTPASSGGNMREYGHLISPVQKTFQIAAIFLFAIFFITPLAAVTVDGVGPQLPAIITDRIFLSALSTSLAIALASTVVALTFSLLIASALVTLSLRHRLDNSMLSNPVMGRIFIPFLASSAMLYLVFPALVMGFGFFILFQRLGGNPTVWAGSVVITANALISIPFAVASLRPAIMAAATMHDRLCASLNLGWWMRWKMVDWPMLRNDLTYVSALAFCFSLGDLGVIALFGSNEFQTLPWLLYQKFGSYRTHEASAIALVLLVLVCAAFWLAQAATKKVKSS